MKSFSDEQALLDGVDDTESETLHDLTRLERKWKRRFIVLSTVFFLAILTAIGSTMTILYGQSSSLPIDNSSEKAWSPAQAVVKYEQRWLTGDPGASKFVAEPGPEMDEAWRELLGGTLIRVSQQELDRANATSIPLKDGGYAAGLGVSHDLHCLNRVNQYIHKDYYYSQTPQDWPELAYHTKHCLEALRQRLLCSADTTLYTLKWTTHSRVKPTVDITQPFSCVNYDALQTWMRERPARLSMLVHPPDEFFAGHEYNEVSGVRVDRV